jgi:hypothetical protein
MLNKHRITEACRSHDFPNPLTNSMNVQYLGYETHKICVTNIHRVLPATLNTRFYYRMQMALYSHDITRGRWMFPGFMLTSPQGPVGVSCLLIKQE